MVRIETEVKLDYKDVLIRPKRSTLRSRNDVKLDRTFQFKHSKKEWTGVPIMVSNMDTTGTFEVALVASKFKVITCLHKHYSSKEIADFVIENPRVAPYLSISAGTSDEDFRTVQECLELLKKSDTATEIGFIMLDVANGYSEHFVAAIKKYRQEFLHHTIIAGNVVTGEMTEELILSGADIVKVGIGPGSVCTTRIQTGVGYPQLSAILECADSAHGLGGCIIADGGITNPGEFAKAFGGGADFAMAGGIFAGHDESGGEIVENKNNGKKYKLFYGMSSTTAMEKHKGQVAEYRSSEGKTVSVPYRGPVRGTLMDILGELRSSCTYVGASALKEISKRATFVRVTQQVNPIFSALQDESKLPQSYYKKQNEDEQEKGQGEPKKMKTSYP